MLYIFIIFVSWNLPFIVTQDPDLEMPEGMYEKPIDDISGLGSMQYFLIVYLNAIIWKN